MNTIEKFLGKNWKTNLLGIVVIAGVAGVFFGWVDVKNIDPETLTEVLGLLMAVGFFSAKDGTASHSRELKQEIEKLKKKMTSRAAKTIGGNELPPNEEEEPA